MLNVKPEWSKSYLIRPRHHLQSHELINEKKRFKPSYAGDVCICAYL